MKGDVGHCYRPLGLLSLGVDVRLFGADPRAVHLENLLWAAAGAGLFALLARSAGAPVVVVWGALLLTSCHPIRSEAILSGVGREELMEFTFVAAALLAARAYLAGGAPRWAAASGLLVALGLLCKETAFAAPGVLAALVLVTRPGPSDAGWRARVLRLALAWALAFALVFAARRFVIGAFLSGSAPILPEENLLAPLPRLERLRGALSLLPLTLGLLAWPARLVADYSSNALTAAELTSYAPVGALLLASLVALSLALLWKRRLGGFALAAALAFYVPFANLLFLSTSAVAERILYPCAGGVALAIACALAWVAARGRAFAALAFAVGLGLAAAGAWRIATRVPEWRDDESLFRAAVRDRPGNARAWINLAVLDLSRHDAVSAERDAAGALGADRRVTGYVRSMAEHARRIGRPEEEAALRRALAASGR